MRISSLFLLPSPFTKKTKKPQNPVIPPSIPSITSTSIGNPFTNSTIAKSFPYPLLPPKSQLTFPNPSHQFASLFHGLNNLYTISSPPHPNKSKKEITSLSTLSQLFSRPPPIVTNSSYFSPFPLFISITCEKLKGIE